MDTQAAGHVLVLFILMALGFASFKLKITTKEAAAYFSSFVLKISLPCLIFYSFCRPFDRELLGEGAVILAVSSGVYLFSLLVCLVYPRLLGMRGPERGVHRYALFIPNAGFVGYPVIEAIMGPSYIFHASLFNVPSNILAFSVGVWLVAKEAGRGTAFSWKVFLNPAIAAIIAGLLVFFFSVSLPGPLTRSIAMVGDMTTPLSMAVIGISIARTDLKKTLGNWRVYVTALMRLLIIPALVGAACYFAGVGGPLLTLTVILTAMPAGSSTSIFASVYDVAVEEAGALVALSTMLSAVTIPLVVVALHWVG